MHFCFELMWLVIQVFVTCVIWCLTNRDPLPFLVLGSQSSVLMIQVFWDVMRCHWASSSWHFEGPQCCIFRVKGLLIQWHSVTSQKTWIFDHCLIPRPWNLYSISYCCSVLLLGFWFTHTGKCDRQSVAGVSPWRHSSTTDLHSFINVTN
jgi:hypothetical protein